MPGVLAAYGTGAGALLAYRAVQLANSLAVSILVARRLGLEMVGTFAVGFIAVAIVTLVAPLGLNAQLPRVRQPHARLCCAGLVLQSLQWPAALPLLYAYARLQAQSPAEADIIFLVALNGPLLAAINVGITLSIMQKKESNALVAAVAESAGVAGALASAHTGAALAVWLLLGRSVGCLLMWRRFRFSWLPWSRMACIGRRSVSYVVPEILSLVADQSGPLFLAHTAPRTELGIFRLCQQLLNAADAPVVAFVQARYPMLVRASRTAWRQTLHRVTQLAVIAAVLCLAGSVALAWAVYRVPRLAPMMAVLSMSLLWRYRGHFYEQAFRAAGLLRLVWVLNGVKPFVFAPVFFFLISRYQAWGAVWAIGLLAVAVESGYGSVFRRRVRPELPGAPSISAASPLVSVVIPAYNVGPWVRNAVESALRQSCRNLEVLVVNDGSTDDTAERLSDLADPRLRIISRPRGGLSEARNTGIRLAAGKYVAFLDGDDEWMRDKLDYHVEVLDCRPEIDFTFSLSRAIDEQGDTLGRTSRRASGYVSLRRLLVDNLVSNGSSAVVRRDVLVRTGGFDATLRACEDYDMWIRIASLRPNNGWCIPRALTCYRIRHGQMTKDIARMQSEWERVRAKARSIAPADVAATEAASRARFHRYLAYLAYENRDFSTSRELLASALRLHAGALICDRRTWILGGALLARHVLSDTAHRTVDRFARQLRARL